MNYQKNNQYRNTIRKSLRIINKLLNITGTNYDKAILKKKLRVQPSLDAKDE